MASSDMVRYAAKSGSGLSYRDATEANAMAETVTNDRPPVAVSASALATHFDCSRAYFNKLEAGGVIQRQGDGFPLDLSRVAYLRYLRRERRQSPRAKADAAHIAVRTKLLELRLAEKRRELVHRDEADALIGGIAGVTLTALSSLPARFAPHGDPAIRRSIERVVFEVRAGIASVYREMADKCGEPPLDE
jgi:hypothetical protein